MFTRIRDLREDRDLSQSTVATILGVHLTTYSDYELGNLSITAEVLITLAKFYNTSTDYILGLTDNPAPYNK